jgi:hypothetical protein
MTTLELISYIEKQIQNNISKDIIISKLTMAGWRIEDINEGFSIFESKSKTINASIQTEVQTEQDIKEIPKIESVKIWTPMNVPIVENKNKEELIPNLIPKEFVDPVVITPVVSPITVAVPVLEEKKIPVKIDTISSVSDEQPKSYQISDLPKIAMLSSYKKDLMSVSSVETKEVDIKKGKKSKWVVIILVLFVVGLIIWLFLGGYIDVKNINLPFIKEDPKLLLLDNSKNLSSLKSYKTETNIEIIFPSFFNISAGLMSGEAVSSSEKDNISINTLGIINQNNNDLLSDNFVTVKGSILPDYITTDIKNNGSDLFVSVPDLSQILGDNAPKSSVIKINEAQFELIPSLFSEKIGNQLQKINFYNILSSGMSSYINNETLNIYDEFINNADISEKGEEVIRGINTYHYFITVDRQLSKKLLNKIAEGFVLNLSDEDKNNLDSILGATTIDSFDVWVGKGDNNIYQYNVVLAVPLSKIIGFEDKSIGDNQIKIDWKTTYYDFNILSEIMMPKDSLEIEQFIKNINEMKTKNEVLSFKELALDLFKYEGSYGKKSNKEDSCMNPTSGSLFSPLGHSKNSVPAVSSISELLNKIMLKTNNNGFCYSTPKAWSFTIPMIDNYDPTSIPSPEEKPLFCIDSTGAIMSVASSPLGVVCK